MPARLAMLLADALCRQNSRCARCQPASTKPRPAPALEASSRPVARLMEAHQATYSSKAVAPACSSRVSGPSGPLEQSQHTRAGARGRVYQRVHWPLAATIRYELRQAGRRRSRRLDRGAPRRLKRGRIWVSARRAVLRGVALRRGNQQVRALTARVRCPRPTFGTRGTAEARVAV
jgi:hypothetical protein